MLRLLAKLFPPRPIVLTGQIVDPQPGQVLVLTTDVHLTLEQCESARASIAAMFGNTTPVFVIAGGARLSVEQADDPCAEGGQDG